MNKTTEASKLARIAAGEWWALYERFPKAHKRSLLYVKTVATITADRVLNCQEQTREVK